MSEDQNIFAKEYHTDVFDNCDSISEYHPEGSLHGPVKCWSETEIEQYNKSMEHSDYAQLY